MTTLSSADRVEFFDVVSAYAKKGLADWQSRDANTQQTIRRDVQNYIEEKGSEIDAKFVLAKSGADPGFLLLPAPKHTHKRHFEVAFFTPRIIKRGKGELDVSFTILLWKTVTAKGETVGFRFESPHVKTPHEYPHVQVCTSFRAPALKLTVPSWIPDSFPAMPMLSRSPYDMFFSMVAAIHGHSVDPSASPMLSILNDSLQSASRTAMIPNVSARISDQFQRLIR